MKSEEAKKLLGQKIKECHKEHLEEMCDPFGILATSAMGFGFPTYLIIRFLEVGNFKYPMVVLALLSTFAAATMDKPLDFNYSRSEYLKFLKATRKVLKNGSNKYEEVEKVDFDKVLCKEFESGKNS